MFLAGFILSSRQELQEALIPLVMCGISICNEVTEQGGFSVESLRDYPSILFGLETAFRHFERGCFELWDTPFSRGEVGIPINGLIWMGDYKKMLEQIEAKMAVGFRCIKLKKNWHCCVSSVPTFLQKK